ncbi:SPOR domain-containing protein [uncultured Thiodictyon sp.]|uniref:SPOR domain-containing protein n=1 Tax=uncultured Thiodictyon sp. TaxID=1846217 RepID=UPI0025EFDC53|nr:SPOR domain-containing protein [uncultured Thiodictyon sp.]
MMREGAKKRLIGAVVVVALAVTFVPMLFEPPSTDSLPPVQQAIPRAPAFDPGTKSEVFLRPQDSGVGGRESAPTVSQPLALPAVGDLAPVPIGAPGRTDTPAAKHGASVARATAAVPGQVQVKSPATPEPARGGNDSLPSWVIQVASVATPDGAAELEGKLRAEGFAAFVEKAEVGGRVTYRVQVGPELDRARADQTAARLRDKHKVNTLIKSYP